MIDKNLKKNVLMKAVKKAGKGKSGLGKVADMNMPGTPGSEMIGGMGMSKYKNLSSKLNK